MTENIGVSEWSDHWRLDLSLGGFDLLRQRRDSKRLL